MFMERREEPVILFQASLSLVVSAANKSQAAETAAFLLNRESIDLSPVQMVNEQGEKAEFRMESVDAVEWTRVEDIREGGRFKVYGTIRLKLRAGSPEDYASVIQAGLSGYHLPRSVIHDHTVWVIPTNCGPAFACVLDEKASWKPAVQEPAMLVAVG